MHQSIPPSNTTNSPSMLNDISLAHKELASPACDAPSQWYTADWDVHEPRTGWYFFYGRLTNISTLAEVIGINEPSRLELHPATTVGYKMKFSGSFPALIQTSDDSMVRGVAFWVQTATQARRLQGYTADSFKTGECCIRLGDGLEGEIFKGITFLWNRELIYLKDEPVLSSENLGNSSYSTLG